MRIPGFTAEISLSPEPRRTIYGRCSFPAERSLLSLQARRAGGGMFGDMVARCVVNCVKRAGGSDATSILVNCTSVCQWNPNIVFEM